MNDLYIARKINELPKEPGWYHVQGEEVAYNMSRFVVGLGWGWNARTATHWLQPTTLENLLSENPQVLSELVLNAKFCHDLTAELIEKYRREGFEAARKEDRFSEVVADGNDYVYSTVQDYINSLKDKKDEKI